MLFHYVSLMAEVDGKRTGYYPIDELEARSFYLAAPRQGKMGVESSSGSGA